MTHSNGQEANEEGIELWGEERCKKHNTRWIRSLGCPFCTNDHLKIAREALEKIEKKLAQIAKSFGTPEADAYDTAQQALKEIEG